MQSDFFFFAPEKEGRGRGKNDRLTILGWSLDWPSSSCPVLSCLVRTRQL